ncbi:cation:proton antiporter [Loigolactobacillus rennini]|uniref:Na+ H+ antiporter n=1 Tax=Loigolactobacillus rennini DSM 20253 TaxID=1423796 RepID=A0A0R2DAE2_9LACO|nr:cation:proton antiporter [Loigolactobacillus rennini]KRM97356.1 Na+ H+ antiporter [Loigolactobacillus rennini DSM 20253]
MAFLGILCLILVTTLLAGHFSRKLGIPAVIGQLLVGIVLGPAMLNWLQPGTFMHDFSEIGVILLMFMAGLESDIGLLKRYLRPGVLVAVVGVIFPMTLVTLASFLFDFTPLLAIFMGVIFTATSVSISVEVLRELKLLDSKEGTTILAAAVVDDVLSVVILSILVSVTGEATGGHTPSLAVSFIEQILYFVGIYFVVKWIAPFLMRLSERFLLGASVTIVSLVICLGMAYLADFIGLSAVVGSFFAGIAVGQTPYRAEVDHNVEPIGYAVFIPVFFVSIGLEMSFKGIGDALWFIVLMTVLAVLTKLVGGGIGAEMAGFDFNSSYTVGAGMVSRGEMALIIAQIGYQAKLIHPEYYSAIIIVIVLTTLLAPFLLKHAAARQLKQHQAEQTIK